MNPIVISGWGRQLSSRRNYYFLIPKDGVYVRPDEEELRFENSMKKGLLMDESSSSLFGCFHGNGYGHLIKIQRSDCEFLSGMKLIQLWGRICTKLGTRKISLRDLARKGPMDLRLLYAVARERTWFGQWGYNFCRGSFGVTKARYNEALESLRSITLEAVTESCGDDNERRKQVEKIIQFYKQNSTLEDMPETIKGLFNRMLLQIMYSPRTPQKKALADAAYSFHDGSLEIELEESEASVAKKIVDTLEKRKRQDAEGTKRIDLLEEERTNEDQFAKVLKKLDGKRVGNHIIHKGTKSKHVVYKADAVGVPGCNIFSDLIYMYQHVFVKIPGIQSSESVKSHTQAVLDTVQFVKEYTKPTIERTLICQLLKKRQDQYFEHGEILVPVQPGATFGDLKQEACRAIKETYCFCGEQHNIVVEAIQGYEESADTAVVPEELVRSRGQAVGLVLQPSDIMCLTTYQGGADALTEVDCTQCGAKEDDGEAMAFCGSCWVSQHQRCHQLADLVVTSCTNCMDHPNHDVANSNIDNISITQPSVAGPSHHQVNIDDGSLDPFPYGTNANPSGLSSTGIGSSSGHAGVRPFHNSITEIGTSSNADPSHDDFENPQQFNGDILPNRNNN
uniref:PHD finger protein At2g01810-like n=1 Tax=Fragaria vesca subsp. vesca TaxID=101020 RepID=UPI0005CA9AE4|nr:PREDICTED: PHD finger protein At2g01810-like [Fragaria vesca subsp. vesca]